MGSSSSAAPSPVSAPPAALWRWLRAPGLERFELSRARSGWRLRGTILTVHEREPIEARYRIACDRDWRTRQVEVTVCARAAERRLTLTAERGRWYRGGREQPQVRGCVDVDLGWSPSTNTLPIRRLGLGVGESSGPLVAAWIRFPELTLEPLPQQYRRLTRRRYRYSSRGGAFRAKLEVDDDGLVTRYGRFWQRVATSR